MFVVYIMTVIYRESYGQYPLKLIKPTRGCLTFQVGKETLAEDIIVAIPKRTHRRSDPGNPTALTEGQRCVLVALIRVMDNTCGTTLADGHLQAIQDQRRVQAGGYCSTSHPAAPGIYDDSQRHTTCPSGDISDIRHPQAIWIDCCKIALEQIGDRTHPGFL